jgi:SnoaL-like domain
MPAEDAQQVAQEFLDAFNASDWERCSGLLADEVTYKGPIGDRANDAEGTLEQLRKIRDVVPGLVGTVRTWEVSDDNSAVAAVARWRDTELDNPRQLLGTLQLTIENGRLASISERHIKGRDESCAQPTENDPQL